MKPYWVQIVVSLYSSRVTVSRYTSWWCTLAGRYAVFIRVRSLPLASASDWWVHADDMTASPAPDA